MDDPEMGALKIAQILPEFEEGGVERHVLWLSNALAGIPWAVTARARYSLNYGLRPIREADGAICVSLAVQEHLKGLLPKNSVVIRNGLPPSGSGFLY